MKRAITDRVVVPCRIKKLNQGALLASGTGWNVWKIKPKIPLVIAHQIKYSHKLEYSNIIKYFTFRRRWSDKKPLVFSLTFNIFFHFGFKTYLG